MGLRKKFKSVVENRSINKLFSDNIIFLDTEFSSLDPYKGEMLSVGLVKVNGDLSQIKSDD